jgi:hypothetical protein
LQAAGHERSPFGLGDGGPSTMTITKTTEALDLGAAAQWLRRRGVGIEGLLSAELVKGGRSNVTFVGKGVDALGVTFHVMQDVSGHVVRDSTYAHEGRLASVVSQLAAHADVLLDRDRR